MACRVEGSKTIIQIEEEFQHSVVVANTLSIPEVWEVGLTSSTPEANRTIET